MDIDLTHPEILTIEQLQTHLRKFVGSELTNDKYELIQLFYKYIAPLPQRRFRANRLGTLLTSNQKQFDREKLSLPTDAGKAEKAGVIKRLPPVHDVNDLSQGDKHESDRGIYTITMQKSASKSTAPIKLKRPAPASTVTNEDDTSKRIKLDETKA